MRLLHTTSLLFHEYFNQDLPPYAILSHRWGEAEPSYQAWLDDPRTDGRGYKKVIEACRLAVSRNCAYIWIDTICIDKRSSAELSEAINSMFKWYRGAVECYAYLADLSIPKPNHPTSEGTETQVEDAALQESSYWSRGWTLQELLAPDAVLFYDRDWTELGSKQTLAPKLSEITGIDRDVLRHSERLFKINVARRMSWAARRVTSREEDMAYCLIGIFDVNMALLYGEGAEKAFFRLQLEILRHTSDDSVFAWATPELSVSGMLAPSPAAFMDSGDIQTPARPQRQHQRPWTWTNLGLELWLPDHNAPTALASPESRFDRRIEIKGHHNALFGRDIEIFVLTCWKRSKTNEAAPQHGWRFKDRVVRIRLKRHGPAWRRVNCNEFLLGADDTPDAARRVRANSQANMVQPISYRLVYVYDDSRRSHPTAFRTLDPTGSSSASHVAEAWQRRNLLAFDSGDFRSYWSLLTLKKLVECIAQEEENHAEPHYHSFYPRCFQRDNGVAWNPEDDLISLPWAERFLPCHYFDCVGGAGYGSLLAIMLGRLRMNVAAALASFEKMVEEVFWSPRSTIAELSRRYGKQPKYDAGKLRAFVQELCQAKSDGPPYGSFTHAPSKFRMENRSLCDTLVTVVETTGESDRVHDLTSAALTPSLFNDAFETASIQRIVTAVTAAPNYLDPTTLNYGTHREHLHMNIQNGGFAYPLNPTAIWLRNLIRDPSHYKPGSIVSIGTGQRTDGDRGSVLLLEDIERFANICIAPGTVHPAMQGFAERQQFEYYRLDPEPEESMYHVALDHPDEWDPAPSKGKKCGSYTIAKMQQAFDRWFANPDVQNHFIECAQSLVTRRRLRAHDFPSWAAYTDSVGWYACFCPTPTGMCQLRFRPSEAGRYFWHLERDHGLQGEELKQKAEVGIGLVEPRVAI